MPRAALDAAGDDGRCRERPSLDPRALSVHAAAVGRWRERRAVLERRAVA
jgi:hypothetical protein